MKEEKHEHKEVESTIKSVGSMRKLIRAMDTHWKWGYACMIPRHLHRGYGRSLGSEAMPGKRGEEQTIVHISW
jgi:hypothetical protein